MKHRTTAVVLAAVLATVVGCSNPDRGLGPAETVEHVSRSLSEGHPVALWQGLPASYQADATELLRAFTAGMDRTLWNKTFAVVAKLSRLLADKQQWILAHPLVAQQLADSGSSDVDGAWKELVGLIDLVANSELADLDQLATLDIEAFLSGTGERIVQQVADLSDRAPESTRSEYLDAVTSLPSVRATLVAEQEGRATVRIESAGEKPRTETLVRVEGKWIPTALADSWPSQMARVRESIAKMSSEAWEQQTQARLLKLSMVEGMLDNLLAANTADQFNTAVGAAMGGMMAMALQAHLNPQADVDYAEPDAAPADAVASIEFSDAPTGRIAIVADAAETALASIDETDQTDDAASPPAALPSDLTAPDTPSEPIDAEPPTSSSSIGNPSTDWRHTPKVPLNEVDQHIGQRLRVVADGIDVAATLAKMDGDTLVFEQALKAGVMTFRLRKNEVQSLHVAR